jgi:hypothetical protein
MKTKAISILLSLLVLLNCRSTNPRVEYSSENRQPFPYELTEEIKNVLPSVVEVVSIIEYEVHEYIYALDAVGDFIEDASSPFGFRFASTNPDSMILKRKESQIAFGSGVLIGSSQSAFLILTSRHVVFHEDSIVQYVKINKKKTNAPFLKAYLKRNDLAVRGRNNSLIAARHLADEIKSDLALLAVSEKLIKGKVLDAKIAQKNTPEPGQLAVVIGYPDEIKQAALGLTGQAPYPGNFSISTYGDFGYSGGPVFAYSPPDGLVFIGIGRSIPAKTVYYIAPDEKIQNRFYLLPGDIQRLTIRRLNIVNPSRMYAINKKYVTDFIKKSYRKITDNDFVLAINFRNLR